VSIYDRGSVNLTLLKYLLDPKNNFKLMPTQKTLNYAAEYGNLASLKYLLDPKFKLTPTQKTLDWAERSFNPYWLTYIKSLVKPEEEKKMCLIM